MIHSASTNFWKLYDALPEDVRIVADKNFELLKQNPRHPSLHFKRVGKFWSARVGISHRVLASEKSDGFVWFWIGSHADYDRLLA